VGGVDERGGVHAVPQVVHPPVVVLDREGLQRATEAEQSAEYGPGFRGPDLLRAPALPLHQDAPGDAGQEDDDVAERRPGHLNPS
jgi:hypothetical protein